MVKHRLAKHLGHSVDGDVGQDQGDFRWHILIFRRPDSRQSDTFASAYQAQELWVPDLAEGAAAIRRYFARDSLVYASPDIPTRDIFVCTHGQRDRCCGCYGYPFYREARHLSQQWTIPNLRLWQISHIGGHRFAIGMSMA